MAELVELRSLMTTTDIISFNSRLGDSLYLPVLRCGGRDPHGSVTAIHTLHFDQSTLLVLLIRKSDETISSRLPGLLISHDLS